MSVYIIGIGGTGARCIESIIHLAASGLYNRQETIYLLFIDADETNGNLLRTRQSLDYYKKCYDLQLADEKYEWMQTPIEDLGLWSPFQGNRSKDKKLETYFEYNNLKDDDPALGNLFDVLYTKSERKAELDVGFRGRPAIGAAVMSQVDLDSLDEQPWKDFISKIEDEAGGGQTPNIFLCGSIFGGTGASGLPTLGRLIHNKLQKGKQVRDTVKLGCLYMLPYFRFTAQPGKDEEVYARSEQFLLNTEAALRYYGSQYQNTFDAVYLLGNQNFSPVNFSLGKNTQCNDPHFIEFYAAIAAQQFISETPTVRGNVVLISREQLNKLTWDDLPQRDRIKSQLVNTTRFAYSWLANINRELAYAKEIGVNKFQNLAPWFLKFYRSSSNREILGRNRKNDADFNDSQQQEAIAIINRWCRDYLRWLGQLHQSPETIQLFQSNYFANPDDNLNIENLSDLVLQDHRDQSQKARDTVQRLKERLNPKAIAVPNQGTVGLAKALYLACKL